MTELSPGEVFAAVDQFFGGAGREARRAG
jgi:hypothetical protein